MSSQLSLLSSSKSEEFSLMDIEVLINGKEQDLFKQDHFEKFLEIEDIRTFLNGLQKCEMRSRQEFEPTRRTAPGWSGPKDQQNKTDKFLSVYGVMYVIVNSLKDKGKMLKEHILKEIILRDFDARILEMQEEHHHQTTQLQLAIRDRNHQIRAIQYDTVSLEAQRDVYQAQLQRCQDQIHDLIINHYVPCANDPGKDNIDMIIEKNTTPEDDEFCEYPYYFSRIQTRFINTKRRWFRAQYPHHRFVVEKLYNANSIYAFNQVEKEGHVERFQCHFRLVDLARDALYDFITPTIHF